MGQQRPDAGLGDVFDATDALDGASAGLVPPGMERVRRARAKPTEVLKMAKATVVQRVKESAEVGSMAHQTQWTKTLRVLFGLCWSSYIEWYWIYVRQNVL